MPKIATVYLDVDGVLFGNYGGCMQLRPHTNMVLRELAARYNVTWLTAWPEDRIRLLMELLYIGDMNAKVSYTRWTDRKIESVDMSNPWYWVDDNISAEDIAYASERRQDVRRLVAMRPYGIYELSQLTDRLYNLNVEIGDCA